jgi:2-iminobutanoate/2-iminopropanoate deaminase
LHLCLEKLTDGEREELTALGMLSVDALNRQKVLAPTYEQCHPSIEKRDIKAHSVLNEAYDYPRPASFSRGMRVNLGDHTMLFISGTASVDEDGKTIHVGDFRAQSWRTYRNITELLAVEGATWRDVVRATCYLRDIERDYKDFNEVRTAFFRWLGLDPLPASTGIQARLCREDLLVEIEAIAVFKNRRD